MLNTIKSFVKNFWVYIVIGGFLVSGLTLCLTGAGIGNLPVMYSGMGVMALAAIITIGYATWLHYPRKN